MCAQKKRILGSRTGFPGLFSGTAVVFVAGERAFASSATTCSSRLSPMKSFLLLVVLVFIDPAVAFVAQPTGLSAGGGKLVAPLLMTKKLVVEVVSSSSTTIASNNDVISSSRRDSLRSLTTSILATAASFSLLSYSSLTANAAIDTYLTEPTEEFKESERQRMEFRKKQLSLKADFVRVLARLTSESSTQEALVTDLKELRTLVTQTGGLPLGIKKEDMYKVIRSKKAKGYWPTDVEIA